MIQRCVGLSGISNAETIMIGDSPQDLEAARQSNIDFLAVTYGFQYTEKECVQQGIPYVSEAIQIHRYFTKE